MRILTIMGEKERESVIAIKRFLEYTQNSTQVEIINNITYIYNEEMLRKYDLIIMEAYYEKENTLSNECVYRFCDFVKENKKALLIYTVAQKSVPDWKLLLKVPLCNNISFNKLIKEIMSFSHQELPRVELKKLLTEEYFPTFYTPPHANAHLHKRY